VKNTREGRNTVKYQVFAQIWKVVDVEAENPAQACEVAEQIDFSDWDDIESPPFEATPTSELS